MRWGGAAALVVAGLVVTWWGWPRAPVADSARGLADTVTESVVRGTSVVPEEPARVEPEGPRLRVVLE
ncbi:hypothetical protein HPC49_53945, partial [Pyxidicoccus fallax]